MLKQALALTLLVTAFLGCSGGDDDDDDSGGVGGYGTCDLREVQHTCIEATGSPRSIEDQKEGCLDATGTWSTDPCPDVVELIGCCEYTFGNRFRECFYEGTSRADPEAYCVSEDLWDDGVWTPAD